jgi:FtsH-binding integral membrane protein
VNPSILLAALGSSVLVFASLSASVLFSPVPSRFYLTGMILSTVSVSFWLTIINLFMQSSALFTLELYLGLFLFSLYVLLDTEVMIRKAEDGSKQYLRHSMDLYVDAISIFIRILVILLRKDEEKERKKRNRK